MPKDRGLVPKTEKEELAIVKLVQSSTGALHHQNSPMFYTDTISVTDVYAVQLSWNQPSGLCQTQKFR